MMGNGNERDERDHRTVTLYDDEALNLMPGWWGSQEDPLYAIHSMGGQHEAWVFEMALRNIDSDIRRVRKIGRDQYQLGRGTFSRSEIDELRIIRDGLQMALDDPGTHETVEDDLPYRYQKPPRDSGRLVMDFATLPDLLQHEQDQNGATHVLVSSSDVWVYYPAEGDEYTVGQAWQDRGYWHSAAPSARVNGALRPDAMPIGQLLSDGHHGHRTSVVDEARGPKFVDVRDSLLEGLRQRGWAVVTGLKVPHATSPDGTTRLWFKTQAIHINDPGTDARRFENTHSLSSDMREFRSVEDLLASVARQSGDVSESGHPMQEYFAVDHTGRVIAGPFTSYSEAKSAADRVRGYVKFAMEADPPQQPVPPPHVLPVPDNGPRMLPPAPPLPSASGRRARPARAPLTRRRSGGFSGASSMTNRRAMVPIPPCEPKTGLRRR